MDESQATAGSIKRRIVPIVLIGAGIALFWGRGTICYALGLRRIFDRIGGVALTFLAIAFISVGISMLFRARRRTEDGPQEHVTNDRLRVLAAPLLILNSLALLLGVVILGIGVFIVATAGPGDAAWGLMVIPFYTLGMLVVMAPLLLCTLIFVYVGRKTLSLKYRLGLVTCISIAIICDLVPLLLTLDGLSGIMTLLQ